MYSPNYTYQFSVCREREGSNKPLCISIFDFDFLSLINVSKLSIHRCLIVQFWGFVTMQSDSVKVSPFEFMSAVFNGKSNGCIERIGGIGRIDDSAVVEDAGWRIVIADVVYTSVAVLIGCFVVLVWRRSSTKKPVQELEPMKIVVPKREKEPEFDDGKKKVTIFFGTQTGTAEGFAKALLEEAKGSIREGFFKAVDLMIMLLMMKNMEMVSQQIMPARFYKWFTEGECKRENGLINFNMECLALVTDNMSISTRLQKVVDDSLVEQGAKRLVPVGLGDDDQCMKMISLHEDLTHTNVHSIHDAQPPCRSNVAVKKELHTPESDRSCTHLEFDISHTGLTYETGDHVGVYSERLKFLASPAGKDEYAQWIVSSQRSLLEVMEASHLLNLPSVSSLLLLPLAYSLVTTPFLLLQKLHKTEFTLLAH
ncbi:unnamed protein product [Lactuca virosa]|uniref:Sulfite reductase [NADPH] flavoprotein alpha-component-like FAD-binding domain-containing protein n=1 Tax=Lactuca virosa TaxID=75947 RepID=A0AAU9MML4_9ASTR|nr:unnamed protein product [Lactuca virosa]